MLRNLRLAAVAADLIKFVGENNAVRSSSDPGTAMVFDPAICGKTDQFVYKFQKPN